MEKTNPNKPELKTLGRKVNRLPGPADVYFKELKD